MRRVRAAALLIGAFFLVSTTRSNYAQTAASEAGRPVHGQTSAGSTIAGKESRPVPGGLLEILSPRLGPASGISTFLVQFDAHNVTGKTITAFSVSITANFPGSGEVPFPGTWDILGDVILSRVPAVAFTPAIGTLNPGEIFPASTGIGISGHSIPPNSVAVRVTSIIFEDRTAVGDLESIQRILAQRKQQSEEMAALLTDLHSVADDPAVQKEMAAGSARATPVLVEHLTARLDSVKGSAQSPGQPSQREFLLRSIVQLLSHGGGPAHLSMSMSNYTILQRAYAEHSTLAEGSKGRVKGVKGTDAFILANPHRDAR